MTEQTSSDQVHTSPSQRLHRHLSCVVKLVPGAEEMEAECALSDSGAPHTGLHTQEAGTV